MDEKSYYERYWSRRPVHADGWMQQQDPWDPVCLRRLINVAKPYLRGAILDAGCGDGTILEALVGIVGAADLAGVDISEEAVDQARRRLPEVRLETANLTELPFADQSFDTIMTIEVVEHLLDVEVVFAEFSRVIKPGGHLVVTTTDFNWPKKVLVAALFFDRYFHPMNPHIRFFTRRTLRRELQRAGFREVLHQWNEALAKPLPKSAFGVHRQAFCKVNCELCAASRLFEP